MREKIQIKNTLFQVALGLFCYFVFFRNTVAATPKKPVVTAGEISGDGVVYTAVYFKDSEYFGKFQIPEKYVVNWWKLSKVLDAIRSKFGSAVLIKKGYFPSTTGLITDSYQMCTAVEIAAQNGKNTALYNTALSLKNDGKIVVVELVKLTSGNIKILISG